MTPWIIYTHSDIESLLEETASQDIGQIAGYGRRSFTSQVSKCPTIVKYFTQANFKFEFNLSLTGLVSINTYSSKGGNYNWHRDERFDNVGPHKKLSLIVQLTDPAEYEGGNFEFEGDIPNRPDPNLLKPKGTVVVFPSYVKHRAAPVTKGCRESLAAWVQGPGFK